MKGGNTLKWDRRTHQALVDHKVAKIDERQRGNVTQKCLKLVGVYRFLLFLILKDIYVVLNF
jgi:hypothetical protein